MISSYETAPSFVLAGCLQLWAVDTHESLPHNVAFQRIYPTAEVAFFFFFLLNQGGGETRRQGIHGSGALKGITWNLGTKSDHQRTVWSTLDEFVSLTRADQTEALRGIGIYR